MKIGICDDNQVHRSMAADWLGTHRKDIHTQNIHQFETGEELLEFLRSDRLDILFLDCQLGAGMDGLETAKVIQLMDKRLTIIMMTDFKDYSLYGYNVDVYKFILKSDFLGQIEEKFEQAVAHVHYHAAKTLPIRTEDGIVPIPIPNIRYIESALRKKEVFLLDGSKHEFYGKFHGVEQYLERYGFVRIHRGYLVNVDYIENIASDRVYLKGGGNLLLSRSYSKKAMCSYAFYSAGRLC